MIGMATDSSFSRDIIARYTGFSDNLSAEAEMLYLRNQGQMPAESAEEVYETNIRNVTNINQYITENPVLPLQVDLRFVGKLISGAVEKIAGIYTSGGVMTEHPAVLKTEGKTVTVNEKETRRLSDRLHSAQGDERPLTAVQAVTDTRKRAAEPSVPYAADYVYKPEPGIKETARKSEKLYLSAAEKEQNAAEKHQMERLHKEEERLVLKERALSQSASDLERKKAGFHEEKRELEHEQEALRRQFAGETVSGEISAARQASAENAKIHSTEDQQEFQTREFPDFIDRSGHVGPEADRRTETAKISSARSDAPVPAEPENFIYPEAAERGETAARREPNRDHSSGDEARNGTERREAEAHKDFESKFPAEGTARRQAAPTAEAENFIYPEAAERGEAAARRKPDKDFSSGDEAQNGAERREAEPHKDFESKFPAEGTARRQAAPTAEAENFIYPEAAERGEAAARRKPDKDFSSGDEAQSGAERREAEAHKDFESEFPAEGIPARRQAVPTAEAENFIYPEAVGHEETAARREPNRDFSSGDEAQNGAAVRSAGASGVERREAELHKDFESEFPAEGIPARRQATPAAEAENFIYPEAAERGETAARRKPNKDFSSGEEAQNGAAVRSAGLSGAERREAEARRDFESEFPAEGTTRRQAAPAEEAADLVLPEKGTAEAKQEEPAAPPKIRFPEKTAQEAARRAESRGSLRHDEPETILKARRLEREGEPAAPVIVARRVEGDFTPASVVYGQPASEEPERRPRDSAKSPLSERTPPDKSTRADESAPRRNLNSEETPFSSDGRTKSAGKNPEISRGPQETLHRPAPFEPARMDYGASGKEDQVRPDGGRTAFSAQGMPEPGHKNDFTPSPETEKEFIETTPSAIRRAKAPAPVETVLPASQNPEPSGGKPEAPGREPPKPRDSGTAPQEFSPAANDLSQKIAAKFRPVSMEQRAPGSRALVGQIREARRAVDSTGNFAPASRAPSVLEYAPAGRDSLPEENGQTRKTEHFSASELVLGNRSVSGSVEDRMAAAGIGTGTRPKKKIVSRTEELHEHTVNRAINTPASSGKPQQVSRAAVEEELMSNTSIRKIADKVYQELESRLRSEKIRRGKL